MSSTPISTSPEIKPFNPFATIDKLSPYAKIITNLKIKNLENFNAQGFLKVQDSTLVLNNTKASFIIGVGGTEGVGFKKIGNSWGPVAFYSGPGMSLGIQIGASNNSIIMMLMNDEGLKLLQGKNAKFSGDLKATAGPTLIDESTKDNSDVYVYSTGTGLDVGASIGVEKLTVNYKKMKK